MYQPKITIITVVYNRANTIEQLLTSVVDQTYQNIEFIVIDGGSTDGTLEIIKKYERYIDKWISEPDEGIYNAMNKGINLASGDYIEIIGSDDALAGENAIANIIHYFDDKPHILSCREYLVYPQKKRQKIALNKRQRDKNTYNGGMVPHAAMFVKRELFNRYKFDESYRISSDYKFFLQCYYSDDIVIKYVDDIVAFFEADNGGASADIIASWEENKRIYKELNLPFNDEMRQVESRSKIKRCIFAIVNKLGIADKIKNFKNMYIDCERHRCNNRICRWCGRGNG